MGDMLTGVADVVLTNVDVVRWPFRMRSPVFERV
jgi:hypothetical protein